MYWFIKSVYQLLK